MKGHNPYFNRWFSAIKLVLALWKNLTSHNPYFNRWFSAIKHDPDKEIMFISVTILILIDGFLQYVKRSINIVTDDVTILILIDGFLQ